MQAVKTYIEAEGGSLTLNFLQDTDGIENAVPFELVMTLHKLRS